MSFQCFKILKSLIISLACNCAIAAPIMWNLQTVDTEIVGREKNIDDIYKKLNSSRGEVKILALTGASGIGKTELAKGYAKNFKNNYDIVWWFHASKNIATQLSEFKLVWNQCFPKNKITTPFEQNQGNIQDLINNIASTNKEWLFILDDLDNKDTFFIKDKLRTTEENWLLIFDDAIDYKSIGKYIPEKHTYSNGHILITSKNSSNIWPAQEKIDVLNFDDSIRILQISFNTAKKDDVKTIAMLLKNHPYSIYNMMKMAKSSNFIGIEGTINTLKSQENHHLDPVRVIAKNQISEVIKKSPEIGNFIKILPYLYKENIPYTLLFNIYKQTSNSLPFDALLEELLSNNIIDKCNFTEKGSSYKIHELMQESLEAKNVEERKKAINTAVAAINQVFAGVKTPCLEESYKHYFDHAIGLLNYAKKSNIVNQEVSKMFLDVFEYFILIKRDFHKANSYIEQMSFITKYTIKNFNLRVRYFIHVSKMHWWLGNHKKGSEFPNTLLALSDIQKDKIIYLKILSNLISHQAFLGNLEKSKIILNEIKTIADEQKKILGDKFTFDYQYLYLMNKINVCNLEGKHEEALALIENIKIDLAEKMKKNYAYFVPIDIIYLETLSYTNKLKLSIKEISALLTKVEKEVGANNRIIAKLKLFKAAELVKIKDLTNANIEISQAHDSLVLWFGSKPHRDIAYSYLIQGDIYLLQKNFKQAISSYTKSLETYTKCFESFKNEDMRRLYERIIVTNLHIREYRNARRASNEYYKIFGKQNADSIKIIALMHNFNPNQELNYDVFRKTA